jgi:hypothetical protein
MTAAEIISALLNEGYPLQTIALATGIKERLLRTGQLNDRDQARLERYASVQPCLRGIYE